MGHHKSNKELRDHAGEQRREHDERRQEIRDEVFEDTDGGVDDLGSQDRRRDEELSNPFEG